MIKQFNEDVPAIDDNGCYDEAQAQEKLNEWINTPEAQLASFTTQQLNDEIARRIFEPYFESLKDMRAVLDSIIANNERPF